MQTDGDSFYRGWVWWIVLEDSDLNDSTGVTSNHLQTGTIINSNAATRKNERDYQE